MAVKMICFGISKDSQPYKKPFQQPPKASLETLELLANLKNGY